METKVHYAIEKYGMLNEGDTVVVISTDSRSLKEQTEILMTALQDFRKGTKRQLNYKVSEPMKCVTVMNRLRKADGLEEGD